MDCDTISRLYRSVLKEEEILHKVSREERKLAFRNMRDIYSPDAFDLNSSVLQILDFDDAAHRCAYMHKYAPLFTALTLDMFRNAIKENFDLFWSVITNTTSFRLCSLGSGPGSDVVGCLAALHEAFGTFPISTTCVDIRTGWNETLNNVFKELEYGGYGLFSESLRRKHITHSFLEDNLLKSNWNNPEVQQAVQSADLITMVKFISSAISKDTAAMVRKIFRACKPGCMVLYIDHSVDKYHQLLRRAADDLRMRTLFGPLRRHLYERPELDRSLYGHHSCSRTRVVAHLWQKPDPHGGAAGRNVAPRHSPASSGGSSEYYSMNDEHGTDRCCVLM